MATLHAIAISLVLAQCGHTLVLVITITRMLTLRIVTRGLPMPTAVCEWGGTSCSHSMGTMVALQPQLAPPWPHCTCAYAM